ncbi:hypothetical protein ACFPZ0_05410 [Streptomonospora nanhaiensis]|uniref:Uncharacterized protein n=1 Tax=Streptomonospora nanhaiensis TaxID=1323731 RepID=A0A853BIR4_9ACTN|nr:hypothetical protein [Streptomonospora nanhaiensis]MBV2365051.1 hypothetical protein [Streptomonospora nanhaiensis]MBX9388280.1 hypothetical protein [Streptomonospora nanhaiensis]NYI94491.1 hypothetical protein [Streptomonospora nanhaiensis]
MRPADYEWQSDFAKKYVAIGRKEGLAQAWAESVLKVLLARGFQVTDEQRERGLSCQDPEQLETWLVQAATAADASRVADVLGR